MSCVLDVHTCIYCSELAEELFGEIKADFCLAGCSNSCCSSYIICGIEKDLVITAIYPDAVRHERVIIGKSIDDITGRYGIIDPVYEELPSQYTAIELCSYGTSIPLYEAVTGYIDLSCLCSGLLSLVTCNRDSVGDSSFITPGIVVTVACVVVVFYELVTCCAVIHRIVNLNLIEHVDCLSVSEAVDGAGESSVVAAVESESSVVGEYVIVLGIGIDNGESAVELHTGPHSIAYLDVGLIACCGDRDPAAVDMICFVYGSEDLIYRKVCTGYGRYYMYRDIGDALE